MVATVRQSPGGSFLGRMARSSRDRVREARERESEGALLARALATSAPPPLRLGTFGVIAELKRRSPAAGALTARDFDGGAQVRSYGAGGAAAVSVLTEPEEFRGSLDDLREAAEPLRAHRIPAMRKDFLTDPYQVLEARATGAGGVLVIVTMLGDAEVAELLACAAQCGLFVLLEGFDEADIERIGGIAAPPAGAAPLLCGVNCRDLRDLAVNRDRFGQLAPYLPPHLPAVAESGIDGADDIAAVASLGYRAALVGSALMRAADPARELAAMRAVGARASGGGAQPMETELRPSKTGTQPSETETQPSEIESQPSKTGTQPLMSGTHAPGAEPCS